MSTTSDSDNVSKAGSDDPTAEPFYDDDDNYTVMSSMTDDGAETVHSMVSLDLEEITEDQPSGLETPMTERRIEVIIPDRKYRMTKYEKTLHTYAGDVVEKVTSGIPVDDVVEYIKRKIEDENGQPYCQKFLQLIQSSVWPDTLPIDDKEEDDFLTAMQSLPVRFLLDFTINILLQFIYHNRIQTCANISGCIV